MTLARWGRRLITGSAVASATLPWLADWNHGHTFGPEYGPHDRWHGTSEVLGATADYELSAVVTVQPHGLSAIDVAVLDELGTRLPEDRDVQVAR